MTTIWKLKNIAPITKMSIESTVATASLAAAITTVLIATKVIAGPASLALIASPAAIAVLFIAAIYFAAAACASYQQMHKNEEISELKAGVEEVKEEIKDLATKDELNRKADNSEVHTKLAEKLNSSEFNETFIGSLEDSKVVEAIRQKGFQKS
ncbi:hypothetical protein [Wolbachia endosymbiont (group B) of Germaria angustata]|uniref:hypothetical protein n=1 Tax=Wolbachia endosymbiont (group B) of Germaria angustata TaxID=3077916 RepID=UPI003132C21C